MKKKISNSEIADVLEEIAKLLKAQDANLFRIRAYQNSAQSIRSAKNSLDRLIKENQINKVKDLPHVGEGIASTIAEYVNTGRISLLDRLKGEISPEDIFEQVPGIGEELAQRIARKTNIHSLEGLEQAAYDGRLKKISGFGKKRLQSVKMSLAGMLSQSAQKKAGERRAIESERKKPPVGLLLEVDEEYRRRAREGKLKKIAPRRFNPQGRAWLPIMHRERKGWVFTALYSNTSRAHELGKVKEWVVIYFEGKDTEGQCTVVTERTGSLKGKRVVRGREEECRDFYGSNASS